MNPVYVNFVPVCIAVIFFVTLILYKWESQFFRWVRLYWNLKRNLSAWMALVFQVSALGLLGLATLDFRGGPENIESTIADQKTIILIDNSASMLVRDIRPNRFERAVTLARHFVKKSVGHQISIILFSDTHKRLLPFTDDLDLLDARLSGLKSLDLQRGSSNISQAIAEALGYFKRDAQNDNGQLVGNILLLTDSEEHSKGFQFSIPTDVNLAIVGLGTQSGGKIPLRSREGRFIGYKRYQGKEVISRLLEENIKSIGENVANFKYWIALSYNIPTEEILSFFRNSFKESLSQQNITVRPIFMHYFVIPAVLLYVFFLIFFKMPSFSALVLILFITEIKSEEYPESSKGNKIFEKFKDGRATVEEKSEVARLLLKENEFEKSKAIYKDIMKEGPPLEEPHLFNYATSMLYSGETKEAMNLYSLIMQNAKDKNIRKSIQNNIMNFLKGSQNNQQQTGSNPNEQQEQPKTQDGDKEEQQGETDTEENKNGGEGQEQNTPQEDSSEDSSEASSEDTSKDSQEESSDEPSEEDPIEESPKTVEEKEQNIEKKRKLTKVPALLKQLMQDDRGLQQRYIDTRTENQNYSADKKDW